MSRNRGTFPFSANFEGNIRGPIDAKMLVSLKSDLIDPSTWINSGLEWTYVGMPVSVSSDPVAANNGLYVLNGSDYTSSINWVKIGTGDASLADIYEYLAALDASIINIDISLNNIWIKLGNVDTSLNNIWTKFGYVDTSLNNLGIKDGYIDVSLNAIWTDLDNIDTSLLLFVKKAGDVMTGPLSGVTKLTVNSSIAITDGILAINGPNIAQHTINVYPKSGDSQAVIAIVRNLNTQNTVLGFIPNGANSASNVNWSLGMLANTNNFSFSSWDGTSSTERLSVTNAGKVGIRNTNPLFLLDVSGDFHTTGVAYLDGSLNLKNQRITGLAIPINSSDATNKFYVDSSFGLKVDVDTSLNNLGIKDGYIDVSLNNIWSEINNVDISLGLYVPYIGATQDLSLGTHGIRSIESIQFNTNPTTTFSDGQLYFDNTYKTLALNLDDDITLQIGQENHVIVYNNTGSTILNGKAVYINGTYGVYPTVDYAIAAGDASSRVIGIATQNIDPSTTGYVTDIGIVHDVSTQDWPVNTILYLSDTIAGDLTPIPPGSPSSTTEIGLVLVSSATIGSILVNLQLGQSLTSLTDVTITNPQVDDHLTFNGIDWINAPGGTISAGPLVTFYLDSSTSASAISFDSSGSLPLYAMNRFAKLKTPSSIIDVSVRNGGTPSNAFPYRLLGAYTGGVINTSLINAGEWVFSTYAAITDGGLTGFTEILTTVYRSFLEPSSQISMSGTGAYRNVKAYGCSPFLASDVDPSVTLSTWLITQRGQYPITNYASATDVSIQVLPGYINDTSIQIRFNRALFGTTTGDLTSLSTTLYKISTIQPNFVTDVSDSIIARYFAHTTVTGDWRTVQISYNGNTNYTNFSTPLALKHNDLAGLQGGVATQRFHITAAEAVVVANTSGINTGNQDLTPYATNSSLNEFVTNIDTSLNNIWTKFGYVDTSLNNLGIKDGYIDVSLNSIWTDLNNVDTSLNNLGIKNGNIDISLNSIWIKLGYDDVSLNSIWTKLGSVDASIVLKADKTYVDGSLALKTNLLYSTGIQDVSIALKTDKTYTSIQDASIDIIRATYIPEASLGTGFTWDNGLLDVSAGAAVSELYLYVDGSLAKKTDLVYSTGIQDVSIALKADKTYVDGSLANRDTSINSIWSKLNFVDTSLNNLGIKDGYIDTSLNSIWTGINNANASLGLYVQKAGDIMSGNLTINSSLFVNGRIGIGTSTQTPGQLSIWGSEPGDIIFALQNPEGIYPSGRFDIRYKVESALHRVGFTDGAGTWIYNFEWASGNAYKYSFPGTGTTYFAGNFGIKNLTPVYTLDIIGSARFDGSLSMSNHIIHDLALPINASDAVNKYYVDASIALKTNLLYSTGVQDVSISSLKTYIDGSLAKKTDLVYSTGIQDVSIASLKTYVDGSLANRDTSINSIWTKIGNIDTSLNNLGIKDGQQDVSISGIWIKIGNIDTSLNNLGIKDGQQDISINSIWTKIGNIDTSLNDLGIKDGNQDVSLNAIWTKLDACLGGGTGDVTKEYVDGSLATKTDWTYTYKQDASILLKTNLLYSTGVQDVSIASLKTYVDGSLALKTNLLYSTGVQDVSIASLKTYVDGSLALKTNLLYSTNIQDVSIALKADKTYVDGSLALKTNLLYSTGVQDVSIALKADKTYVDGSLALKANKSSTDASLALKTNLLYSTGVQDVSIASLKTYIDGSLATKTDISYSTEIQDVSIASKTDLTYTSIQDASIDLKTNLTYTSIQDASIALKTDWTYTSIQDASIDIIKATYIPEVSLGTGFTWNNGLLDVSSGAAVSDLYLYVDGSLAAKTNWTYTYKQDASIALKTNLLYSTGIQDVSIASLKTYVDGSLALKTNLIYSTGIQDISIAKKTDILYSTGIQDVSIASLKTYVDGSLLLKTDFTYSIKQDTSILLKTDFTYSIKQDNSISALQARDLIFNASIGVLQARDLIFNASIGNIDISLNDLGIKNGQQDVSINSIWTKIGNIDTSLNNLGIKDGQQDVSISGIWTKIGNIDTSLNNLGIKDGQQDVSIVSIWDKISNVDTSLNNLGIKDGQQDVSINSIWTKIGNIDISLNNLSIKTGNIDLSLNLLWTNKTNLSYSTGVQDVSIALKADKTYVDASLNVKANLTYVDSSISTEIQKWIDINRCGFVNEEDVSVGFDASTYVVTLTGNGNPTWTYFQAGKEYTINHDVSIQIGNPPAKGIYYVTIPSTDGALSVSNTSWTLFDSILPVCTVNYDASLSPKYQFAEELHQSLIDRRIFAYLHFTRGTQFVSGGVLSGPTLTTASNAAVTFGVSQTVVADEDMFETLPALTRPDGSTSTYTIIYRTDSSTWKWVSDASIPFLYGPTNRIRYDNGNGVMTEAPNTSNRFYNYYLAFTNWEGQGRYVLFPGRGLFTTLALAQAEKVTNFDFTGFPLIESVIGYQFTWQLTNTNTNMGKVGLAATPVKINVASITSVGSGAGTDHNTLAGLQGGTPGEYYHLTSAEYTDIVGRAYVDGSLALKTDISYSTGVQDVSIATLKTNVDTSLNNLGIKDGQQDISINSIWSKIGNVDTSLNNIYIKLGSVDTSLNNIYIKLGNVDISLNNIYIKLSNVDISLNNLGIKDGQQDVSISSIWTKIGNIDTSLNTIYIKIGSIDTSLNNLGIKDGEQDVSINSIWTKIGNIDTSLNNLGIKDGQQDVSISSIWTKIGNVDTSLNNIYIKLGNVDTSLNNLGIKDGQQDVSISGIWTKIGNIDISLNNLGIKDGQQDVSINSIWAKIGNIDTSLNNIYIKFGSVDTSLNNLGIKDGQQDVSITSIWTKIGNVDTSLNNLGIKDGQQDVSISGIWTKIGNIDISLNALWIKDGYLDSSLNSIWIKLDACLGGGGATGSSTLAGLTDVSIASLLNNDTLKYNSTYSKWKNKPDLWDLSTNNTSVILYDQSTNLELSSIELLTDGGALTFVDMPIANPATASEQSYSMKIDGSSALRIYGTGDASSLSEIGVVIDANYFYMGDPCTNGSYRFLVDAAGLNIQKLVDKVWVQKLLI